MPIINPTSGDMKLIGAVSYSNQAAPQLSFPPDIFETIQIELISNQNVTNDTYLRFQVHDATNGWYESGYTNSGYIFPDSGQAIGQLSLTTGIVIVPNLNNYRAVNTGFASGSVKLYSLGGEVNKRFNMQSRYTATNLGNFNNALFGGGAIATTDPIDAIRLVAGTGNITGKFNVYGLKG